MGLAGILAVTLAPCALDADAKPPPRAAAMIAPVHRAYEKIRAEQAKLPPPKNASEALLRLEALDQAGRAAMGLVNLEGLGEAERRLAMDAIWNEVAAQDLENQKKLKALLPKGDWFRISLYGKPAATAAFLIVQHAVNDPPLMRAVLAKMEGLRPLGEVSGEDYALL